MDRERQRQRWWAEREEEGTVAPLNKLYQLKLFSSLTPSSPPSDRQRGALAAGKEHEHPEDPLSFSCPGCQ